TRRFWMGLLLSLPVLLLAFGDMIPGVSMDRWILPQFNGWIQLMFATPVVFWAGSLFFARGWRSLISRHFNMFTLIMLGVGAAWAYSAVAVVAPAIFPA